MVRYAEEHEVEQLATIWYDAWHDAHAHLMPESLIRQRTLQSFAERIRAALPDVRVGHIAHEPVGFCIVKDDELYQLFVAARARGSGIAAQLVADAEARLAERGVTTAWLACAIGNDRAARFYEKCGWQRTATITYQPEVTEGNITFDVWRYEKTLR
jgi:ribosomal protein S18 acetylase RimI-like enzyme